MSTSRMDKYRDIDNEVDTQKRTSRNRNIYDDIKTSDYENVNLSSNVSVINTPLEDLDIDKLKKILDEKYKEKQNRKAKIEVLESDTNEEELENTKEYDLKKVLEEAHKNKTTDYDHERFMKLRETQYDILKSLNVERPSKTDNQDGLTTEEANLMNLIKTVNYNAEKNKLAEQKNNSKETLEEDLFSDLMGDDNTEVLEPMTFDDNEETSESDDTTDDTTEVVGNKKPTIVEELERTKQLSKTEIFGAISKYKELKENDTDDINDILDAAAEDDNDDEDDDDETQEQTLTKTEELSNSFYTGKFQISKKDLDDFKDLEGDMTSGSLIIKILIILIVLIILALAVFLLNKYLNLGLF